MKQIKKVVETKEVQKYLQKRQLIPQYSKACTYITSGFFGKIDFKLRQPKQEGVWSFRINKQFRAYGILEGEVLLVFNIYNHQ